VGNTSGGCVVQKMLMPDILNIQTTSQRATNATAM
jgi:hypothetical protein